MYSGNEQCSFTVYFISYILLPVFYIINSILWNTSIVSNFLNFVMIFVHYARRRPLQYVPILLINSALRWQPTYPSELFHALSALFPLLVTTPPHALAPSRKPISSCPLRRHHLARTAASSNWLRDPSNTATAINTVYPRHPATPVYPRTPPPQSPTAIPPPPSINQFCNIVLLPTPYRPP